jgi:hypothetical protein
MKNVLSLAAVAGILVACFAPAAHADEFVARYTYLVNGGAGGALLNQPALIGAGACGTALAAPIVNAGCNTLTAPAVIDNGCGTLPAVVGGGAAPIMVQDHENIVPHILHIGLWPLVDFSIF